MNSMPNRAAIRGGKRTKYAGAMRIRLHRRHAAALTRIEIVVILFLSFVLLLLVIVPLLRREWSRSQLIACTSNLKQIGLGFRVFANDNGDAFPMNVPGTNGGSREYRDTPDAFPHWRALSNALTTPLILVCPADSRKVADRVASVGNSNISYFLGLAASDTESQSLLSGDRKLTTNGVAVGSGVLLLTTNLMTGWTPDIHHRSGNVLLGDGSVQQCTGTRLRQVVVEMGSRTNWLVFP